MSCHMDPGFQSSTVQCRAGHDTMTAWNPSLHSVSEERLLCLDCQCTYIMQVGQALSETDTPSSMNSDWLGWRRVSKQKSRDEFQVLTGGEGG